MFFHACLCMATRMLRLVFFTRVNSWKVFVGCNVQKFLAEKSSVTEIDWPYFQAFVVGVFLIYKNNPYLYEVIFFFSLCPACQVQNPRRVEMSRYHLHRLCVQTHTHSRQLLRHYFILHPRKRRQTQPITALHYRALPRRKLWHHLALLQWNSTLLW